MKQCVIIIKSKKKKGRDVLWKKYTLNRNVQKLFLTEMRIKYAFCHPQMNHDFTIGYNSQLNLPLCHCSQRRQERRQQIYAKTKQWSVKLKERENFLSLYLFIFYPFTLFRIYLPSFFSIYFLYLTTFFSLIKFFHLFLSHFFSIEPIYSYTIFM